MTSETDVAVTEPAPTAKKAPVPPDAIAQRAALVADLAAGRAELENLAVRLAQEGPSEFLSDAIAAVRSGIAESESALELHDLAQQRLAVLDKKRDRTAERAEIAAMRKEVIDIGKKLPAVFARLVATIEDAGPLLAELVGLMDRCRELAYNVACRTPPEVRERLLQHSFGGHNYSGLEIGLWGAFQRSGIGAIGPRLEPFLRVGELPSTYSNDLSLTNATLQLAKDVGRYEDVVAKAVAAIEAVEAD